MDFLGQPEGAQTGMQVPRTAPPSGGGTRKSFNIIDLKQYFHIVVKRIWLVALCFVLSLAVMVVILVRQVPVYRASSMILLSQGLPLPRQLSANENRLLQGSDYIETQKRVIESGMIMQRARQRLGRPASEISSQIQKINVFPIHKTSFISISVESLDPVLGAELANTIAEEYVEFKSEERMDTSQATVISLTQQANRIREELTQAEEKAFIFTKENNVVAIEERGNIAATILANLAKRAAEYRTEKLFLESQGPLIQKATDDTVLEILGGGQSPMYGPNTFRPRPSITDTNSSAYERTSETLVDWGVVESAGWQGRKRQKALMEARLVELRKRFHDAHPDIQATLEKLRQVESELDVELEFVLQQYYAKLQALTINERAANKVMLEWEDEALDASKKAQEFRNLERRTGRLHSLYDLVFNRLKEIDLAIGLENESIKILERAQPATRPTSPRKMQSIFLAAVIGLGIGLGLVFGLEFLDDSIRYPEDVTHGLALPFFGVIPSANWDEEDLRTQMLSNIDNKSSLAEAYRNIRSAFLFSGYHKEVKAIGMISSVPKEGKTTTCLNLAISLAQSGERVLLVDGDLRRGKLHKFFTLDGGRGFSDILVGQAKPESVIQRTGLHNLDLIATGPFPPNPAELILRPELKVFMDYAKRTYDRILFDCPPVMAVSESCILASLVDANIFVVWAGQTSKKLTHAAVQVLRERGANLMGVILNNLEYARVGYYYYSTQYGYYDYDGTYARAPEEESEKA
jgi:capsular exopolysaccharide synthesis family protein